MELRNDEQVLKDNLGKTRMQMRKANFNQTPSEELQDDLNAKAHSFAFQKLFLDLMENTGMHGLPNIRRSQSKIRTLFWTMITLAAFGAFIWQFWILVVKYLGYPTSTDTTVTFGFRLQFPAITLCNNNPVRMSAISQLNLTELEDALNATYSDDWSLLYTYMDLYAQLDSDVRYNLGYSLESMLIDCYFGWKACTTQNFTQFNDIYWGNCYTFNSGRDNASIEMVSKIGPSYGLQMTLYAQQNEYIQALTDGAGFRVIIHNQTDMPFPQDEGFSVSPGTHAYVGLKRSESVRAESPYGSCENITGYEAEMNNLWTSSLGVGYSTNACKKTCYQLNVIEECGCGDVIYPLNSSAIYQVLWEGYAPACKNDSEWTCLYAVEDKYLSSSLNCSSLCPPKCVEVAHDYSLSFAGWPSLVQMDSVIDSVLNHSTDDYTLVYALSSDEQEVYIKNNVVKLSIYFQTMDYVTVETSPSYKIDSLISDFGGQVGLWLACSVITLCEVVELLADIVRLAITRCAHSCGPDKTRTITTVSPTAA